MTDIAASTSDPTASASSATPAPRYRCTACGNLTRFDVRITSTTTAFHHYTVGGELEVEDLETIHHQVDDVSCRWCSSGAHVVEVAANVVEDAPGS